MLFNRYTKKTSVNTLVESRSLQEYNEDELDKLEFAEDSEDFEFSESKHTCEKCGNSLNDEGTCPYCDHGEQELPENLTTKNQEGDTIVEGAGLSNKEKLLRAYPELNFDSAAVEESLVETMSVRDKLKAVYPELNFDTSVVDETLTETMSVRDTLQAAYPELDVDNSTDLYAEYDDDYFDLDDVEQDRAHAALYGGDRMYCDCGKKLIMTEWGGYCPDCDPQDFED